VSASPKEFCAHVKKVLHVLQDEEDYKKITTSRRVIKKLHNTD